MDGGKVWVRPDVEIRPCVLLGALCQLCLPTYTLASRGQALPGKLCRCSALTKVALDFISDMTIMIFDFICQDFYQGQNVTEAMQGTFPCFQVNCEVSRNNV